VKSKAGKREGSFFSNYKGNVSSITVEILLYTAQLKARSHPAGRVK
jgi:hypothetical protein